MGGRKTGAHPAVRQKHGIPAITRGELEFSVPDRIQLTPTVSRIIELWSEVPVEINFYLPNGARDFNVRLTTGQEPVQLRNYKAYDEKTARGRGA
jgi:hypothetical protein